MTATRTLQGRILTADGWMRGTLEFDQRVRALHPGADADDGGDETLILPGFIDLHVHGGGGRDIMDAGDAVHVIARMHARHGTTSMLATTMTSPISDLEQALEAIGHACWSRREGTARVLGVHLEGPYINPGKLGAQPDYAQAANLAEIERLSAFAPLKLITVAPEIPGHLEFVKIVSNAGIRVQIGHTLGTYEDGLAALQHGAAGFTHLFNAMSAFHHRAPGMAGAALAHAERGRELPDQGGLVRRAAVDGDAGGGGRRRWRRGRCRVVDEGECGVPVTHDRQSRQQRVAGPYADADMPAIRVRRSRRPRVVLRRGQPCRYATPNPPRG